MSLTPYLSIAIRSIPKPNANPEYFFVSIENFYGSDEEFAKILLIRYKIAVVPGSAYGDTTHRFIRLSFGTETDEDIRYALDCIKNVMTTRDHDLIAINAEYESWRFLS